MIIIEGICLPLKSSDIAVSLVTCNACFNLLH